MRVDKLAHDRGRSVVAPTLEPFGQTFEERALEGRALCLRYATTDILECRGAVRVLAAREFRGFTCDEIRYGLTHLHFFTIECTRSSLSLGPRDFVFGFHSNAKPMRAVPRLNILNIPLDLYRH